MLKILALLIVALLSPAEAYDFSDLDYNQYLFNEFESLNTDVSVARQRRDTENAAPSEQKECPKNDHHGKKDFACCMGDKFDPEYFKKMHEIKKQCAIKLRANNSDVENFDPFDCDKMSRIKQLIICEGECFARAVNIIDESGEFNRDAIIKRFSEHMVGEIEWKKAVFEDYIGYCLAQVESKKQENPAQCSSAAMDFHHCIWGKFITGCPEDLRVDSTRCNKMREHHSQISSEAVLHKHLLFSFLHRAHKLHAHSSEQKEM